MIPNWLLGKSKSKLQEILGGGGSGTTYTAGEGINITGHEISVDPLLMVDIEQTALAIPTKAPKTAISNTNILHNPWFQVNQRKFTTAVTNGYAVDRWARSVATTGQTTYTLNANGTITIDNSLGETQAYLIQRRTAKTIDRIKGKKITASIMLSDGTVHSGTGTYVATETTTYYEDDDIKIQSIAQTLGQFFVLRVEAGKTITVKALKLELGEISTLAMDIAPDMAIELAKCQRYFQTVNSDGGPTIVAFGVGRDTTTVQFVLDMPSEFRTRPTIDYQNIMVSKSADATSVTLSSLELAHITQNHALFTANVTGSTAGTIYHLIINTLGYINFDAEL